METEKIIMKHEESKETREVVRAINSPNTTGTVEDRVEPAITLKGSIKTFNVRAQITADNKTLKTETAQNRIPDAGISDNSKGFSTPALEPVAKSQQTL